MGRWVSEQAALDELERLGDRAVHEVQAFYAKAEEAARAEIEHKTLRAQAILRAKARDPKMSIVLAEAHADADEQVSAAHLQRLITAAALQAAQETLRTIRTNQDGLRTAVASHRNPIT